MAIYEFGESSNRVKAKRILGKPDDDERMLHELPSGPLVAVLVTAGNGAVCNGFLIVVVLGVCIRRQNESCFRVAATICFGRHRI